MQTPGLNPWCSCWEATVLTTTTPHQPPCRITFFTSNIWMWIEAEISTGVVHASKMDWWMELTRISVTFAIGWCESCADGWCRFTLWRVCVSSFSLSDFCSTTGLLEIHDVSCLLSKWQMSQQSSVSHCCLLGGLRLYCDSLRATASVIVCETCKQRVLNLKRALRQ